MRIEPLQPGAEAEWDAFCRARPTAWFWHTTDWTNYMLAARPGGRSLAFAIRDGRELAAIVPLVLEGDAFSLGGAPCWAPAATDDRVLRAALDHVDALAAEHGVARAAFQTSPLTELGALPTELLRAGYLELGRTSQVLPLTPDRDALRRGMSKGHRAAVKKGAAYPVEALSGPAATHAALHRFRALHEAAAGRRTRPPETYDRMAEWAQRGDGLLVLIRHEGEYVGGSYISVFAGRAYYLSSAMDRALSRQPIGHALQWAAIEWMVDHEVGSYELGLQQFGPVPHDIGSDKERAISRFKRGFGGSLRLAGAWEKWYSADAYRTAAQARLNAYAATVGH